MGLCCVWVRLDVRTRPLKHEANVSRHIHVKGVDGAGAMKKNMLTGGSVLSRVTAELRSSGSVLRASVFWTTHLTNSGD